MKRLVLLFAAALAAAASAHDADERDAARAETLKQAEANLRDALERMTAASEMVKLRIGGTDRAFLGVLIADQDEAGIVVAGVSPDSGAEEAGLQADDVIVAINNESLLGDERPLAVLNDVLADIDPGDAVTLNLLRDGAEQTVDVVTSAFNSEAGIRHLQALAEEIDIDLPFDWRINQIRSARNRRANEIKLVDIGEDLGEYFDVDAGVLVLDTPARSELKPGDILKRVDGAAVSSAQDGYRLLRRLREDAEAQVLRKKRSVTVAVSPPRRERRRALFIGPGRHHRHD